MPHTFIFDARCNTRPAKNGCLYVVGMSHGKVGSVRCNYLSDLRLVDAMLDYSVYPIK
jgi:glutamine synthetase adenylyltransferase